MNCKRMNELPYLRFATAPKFEGQGGGVSVFQPGAGPSKVCAYNQTRERFISVDVDAGDFAPAVLNNRLPSLTAGCNTALWIVPFRGISPTSVRFPIDLVFLDERGVVLFTVDSFPISQVPNSGTAPASVLALPAQSIASTATGRGDQLLLHPPEEMKVHLQQLAQAKAQNQAEPSEAPGPSAGSVSDSSVPKAVGNLLPWVDRSRPVPAVEQPISVAPVAPIQAPPALAAPVAPSPAPQPSAPEQPAAPEPNDDQPWVKRHKAPKGWLERLLASEPADPRRAQRLAIPWLGAYFFTGGKPVAYAVRDISSTGLYVLTEERWYPGTVIRVTLADGRHPTPDRSFTANARVMRAGKDGVGFQFVLNEDRRSGKQSGIDNQALGVDREQIELFLHRLRNAN